VGVLGKKAMRERLHFPFTCPPRRSSMHLAEKRGRKKKKWSGRVNCDIRARGKKRKGIAVQKGRINVKKQ